MLLMKSLNPIIGMTLCAAAMCCSSFSTAAVASDSPPNIVFIFVDDQGYYDLGCYGATEVMTPRIDAMAEAGTRFTSPVARARRVGCRAPCTV